MVPPEPDGLATMHRTMFQIARLCAFRCWSSLVAVFVALLAFGAAAAHANTASVSVGVSANPTQGVPVMLTVSRSSELARSLYVYLVANAAQCESDPDAESSEYYLTATVLANGAAIGPGSFSAQYMYTPPDANESYIVCAYVDDAVNDTPDAQNAASFTANQLGSSGSGRTPNPSSSALSARLFGASMFYGTQPEITYSLSCSEDCRGHVYSKAFTQSRGNWRLVAALAGPRQGFSLNDAAKYNESFSFSYGGARLRRLASLVAAYGPVRLDVYGDIVDSSGSIAKPMHVLSLIVIETLGQFTHLTFDQRKHFVVDYLAAHRDICSVKRPITRIFADGIAPALATFAPGLDVGDGSYISPRTPIGDAFKHALENIDGC